MQNLIIVSLNHEGEYNHELNLRSSFVTERRRRVYNKTKSHKISNSAMTVHKIVSAQACAFPSIYRFANPLPVRILFSLSSSPTIRTLRTIDNVRVERGEDTNLGHQSSLF